MARRPGSIPAVPPQTTGEMYSFLQAVRQSLVAAETNLASTRADIDASIAAAEETTAGVGTDLTALEARVTAAEADIATLQSDLNAAEAAIAERADKDQEWDFPIFIEYPTAKTYRFFIKTSKTRTITEITVRTGAGTCTVDVQIDGISTNTGPIAASTTESSESPTSSNSFAENTDLSVVITSPSSVSDLSINIKGVEVLL